ncbi:transposase [Microbacterium luticocti]|uniref:transposase n=1 Tax=Microbacterium luticocti TaxID=451764 RepID=UPI00048D622C|nr:transposase [Microbacterium luticocti]
MKLAEDQSRLENLTAKQQIRLTTAIEAESAHDEVFVVRQCAQHLRFAYPQEDLAEGRPIAEKVVDTFRTSPIPEIARPGRTVRCWRDAFLAYFTTHRANNGGTEAANGITELHRRRARLPQQAQLPATHTARRRRPHAMTPTRCPKSRFGGHAVMMSEGCERVLMEGAAFR